MKSLISTCREHWHFFLIVPLLIILMTWPTFRHVFDTDGYWLVNSDIDANMLFWDAWYAELIAAGKAEFYFTDLLFHPDGVSLAFHNFSLPHMVVFAGLQSLLPGPNAYNLTYLLLTIVTIASGYIYLNYLFRDKWIALFGAIAFGASGFVLSRGSHPSHSFVATVPLSLYFVQRALLEKRWKFMLVAGFFIGVTAFIGMYMLVNLLLTLLVSCLVLCSLALARRRISAEYVGLDGVSWSFRFPALLSHACRSRRSCGSINEVRRKRVPQ